MLRIQEMRAFQQTVQAYTHTTASPVSPRNQKHAKQSSSIRASGGAVNKSPVARKQDNHTASTDDTSNMLKRELVPSFLKALYITSEDTIFDDEEIVH